MNGLWVGGSQLLMTSLDKHWSEPIIFKVIDSFIVPDWVFNKKLVFLDFEQKFGDIESPDCDIVGIAFRAGSRRYCWNGSWWGEYSLSTSLWTQRLNDKIDSVDDDEFQDLINALEWLDKSSRSTPPEPEYVTEEVKQYFKVTRLKGNKRHISQYSHKVEPKRHVRVIIPLR